MDLRGAEIRNIMDFCSVIGTKESVPMRVNIPYYQRPYKWEEDNIRNLITDFYKNSKNEYFVGSAVMIAVPDRRHDVIDGQQRVTTMFLLGYIKVLLERAYIEELISKRKSTKLDTSLSRLEEIAGVLFGAKIKKSIEEIHKDIVYKIDNDNGDDENLYDNLLVAYQKTVFLPEKNLTDTPKYLKECYHKQQELIASSDLALKYSRESYNLKLKNALANSVIILSDSMNPELYTAIDNDNKLEEQYTNAIKYEFNELNKAETLSHCRPLDYSVRLIEAIESIIKNIKFCVIITGNEKDAYTLFEVLNDRALEIEDLDLIKNLFYKWYCNHSSEDDAKIDSCIEEVDKIWIEDVFPPDTGKERSKLISFLAAEYFTADDSLKFNDNEKYRELIETKYLIVNKNVYSSLNITNDFYVYQMIAMILKKFQFAFKHKNEKVLSAETDAKKSITYKSIHLLNALKQYGVIPAITNMIIKSFVDTHADFDKKIKINEFSDYIDRIINDYKNDDSEFKEIHTVSFMLWRCALLAKSADLPRVEAKKIIAQNNIFKYVTVLDLTQTTLNNLTNEFDEWTGCWKYGSRYEADLKVKVLFINLFYTNKDSNKLKLGATSHSFNTSNIQLDHMEAHKINESAAEKYFTPSNEGEDRNQYINGLGNFMIMDEENNNNKNNQPLVFALEYYDNMSPKHWMITEVRDMLRNDEYSKKVCVGNSEYYVPKENFFVERKNRLLKYFKAMLVNRTLDDTSMDIL